MASDFAQVLSATAGSLVSQNQSASHQQPIRQVPVTTSEQVTQITQIASAQTATKAAKNDRERGTQVPKRPEAGFASEEQNQNQESLSSLPDGSRRLRAKA